MLRSHGLQLHPTESFVKDIEVNCSLPYSPRTVCLFIAHLHLKTTSPGHHKELRVWYFLQTQTCQRTRLLAYHACLRVGELVVSNTPPIRYILSTVLYEVATITRFISLRLNILSVLSVTFSLCLIRRCSAL